MRRPAVRKKMGRVVKHFSHKEHPLEFMSPRDAQVGEVQCSLCKSSSFTTENFYGCLTCNYFLDPLCANIKEKTYLLCHFDHPVTLITSPPWSTLRCKACGVVIPGPRYNCGTCSYDFHHLCSTWPQNMEVEDHQHPLCLNFPHAEGRTFKCRRCDHVDDGFWGYRCKECTEEFFIHLDCNAFKTSSGSNDPNRVGHEASIKDVAALNANSLKRQSQEKQVKDIIEKVTIGVGLNVVAHCVPKMLAGNDTIHNAAEIVQDQIAAAAEDVADGADEMIEEVQETAEFVIDVVANVCDIL